MAEFRKASADFKNAFETEMREMERQAAAAERKKQADAAAVLAAAEPAPATLATPEGVETTASAAESGDDTRMTEAPIITPVAEAVPRGAEEQPTAATSSEAPTETATPHESVPDSTLHDPSHDLQRPS